MNYVIRRARTSRDEKWGQHTYTLQELETSLFSFHREDDAKDGPAFMAGDLVSTQRNARAVTSLCMFVFDIDGAQSVDYVRERIKASGLYAFIYTTYSHRSAGLKINTDKYVKWAKKQGLPERHTEDNVKKFLVDTGKAHLKIINIAAALEHTSDGICIGVTHEPVDKVRIVLPMAEPFVVSAQGYSHGDCIRAWKETYAGIGVALGLDFDKSCMDVCRLNYLPSHPPMASEYWIEKHEGKLIDYKDFEKADVTTMTVATGVETPRGTTIDNETAIYENWNVGEWFYHHGKGTGNQLIDLINDEVKGARGGDKEGYHITCPFESNHSKEGGLGTFIDPGTVDGYPKIHCCHDHCSGIKTEGFIAGMLEEGWFTRDDLISLGKKARTTSAFASVGLDPSTLAVALTQASNDAEDDDDVDISNIGPVHVDEAQKSVVATLKAMAKQSQPVPEGIIDRLYGATTAEEVRATVREAVDKGAVDERALSLFCLAASGMSFKAVKAYYGAFASDIGINSVEFVEVIKYVRSTVRTLDSAVVTLTNTDVQNAELAARIRQIAAYYDVSVGEIERTYHALRESNTSVAEGELNRRGQAFSARYAKWVRSTAMYFIDIPTTLRTGVVKWYTREALANMYSNVNVRVAGPKGSVKEQNAFAWWMMKYPAHTVYDEVVFDPSMKRVPEGTLNTFFGFNAVKPVQGDVEPIRYHLLNVWCNGDEEIYNWLTTLFANIFQNPGKRYPVAVAIVGNQGSGKSFVFTNAVNKMIAPYGHSCISRDEVSGRFNAALQGKLLLVADESLFSGDHATANKLKGSISEPTINIERKGMDSEVAPNLIRYFFTSNEEHVLKVDPDDRRYLILHTAREHAQDKVYFGRLKQWLDNGGREAWMYHLLNWKPEDVGLTWDSLQTAPRTVTKMEQIAHSLGPVDNFYRELALFGYVGGGVRDASLQFGNIYWEMDEYTYVEARKFNDLFEAYLKEQAGASRNHVRSHIRTKADKMFGKGFMQFMVPHRDGDNRASPHVRLPPRRKALEMLVKDRYITEEEFDAATSV